MSLLIGLALCLLLSAFFSASEMAFLSTDRVKLRDASEQGNPQAKKILDLYRDSRQFLATVLLGNNLVNVGAAAFLTAYLEHRFGIHDEWVVTALLVPFLVIFCETAPKDYGRQRAESWVLRHTEPILFFSKLLSLPGRLLLGASEVVLGGRKEAAGKNIFVSEDEFRFLIEESVRSGVLDEHKKKLVERILDFERIPVDRVLVPVCNLPHVELSQKVKDAKEKARQSGSKLLLVYEEIPSLVIGMIYVFDLLFEDDDEKGLREFLCSPTFLPRETPLEKAFLTLQERRQSFALVTDARNEVVGAVDIENLVAI